MLPQADTLPHAPAAEVAVLGGMLMDAQAVPAAMEVLTEDDFYSERNRLVFRAIIRLFDRGTVIDPVTVVEELQAMGVEAKVGGMAYLAELLDATVTAADIAHHAGIVAERAQLRSLYRAAGETMRDVLAADGTPVPEILDRAQRRVFEVVQSREGRRTVTMRQAMGPTFEDLERRTKAGGGIYGVPSGLYDLDEMTGGFQKGDLVILAARPSMGKTSLALGFALHAALEHCVTVAIYSLEMSTVQLTQRALAYEARINLMRLLKGKLEEDEYMRLATVAGYLNTSKLWLDDRSPLSITQIRASARRLKAMNPDLGLIVLDYVQLVTADAENRTQEVTQVSKGLKTLAKELQVPVIALSQLSRETVKRKSQRPQLSDLRESGALEQDADLVMFVHRPEYYLTPGEAEEKGFVGKAELIIAKQRNGPTGIVDLYFRKECARFESLARV